jgi:hypothetical protein
MVSTGLTTIVRKALGVSPAAAPCAETDRPAWMIADLASRNPWTIADGGVERRFFFITGCSKSGTHWVQNLLNLSPEVCVKGEFHFEHLREGYLRIVEPHHYPSSKAHLRPVADASYQGMVRRLMYAAAQSKPEATWIGDRSPRVLEEILPGAPTVNIRRDGRDVLVSWNFHHMRMANPSAADECVREAVVRMAPRFQASPNDFASPGSGLLGDEGWFRSRARVWADVVGRELDAAPRWRDAGTPLLQVRYEHLHADVEQARAGLYGFLGVDPAKAAPIGRETRTEPGFEGATHLEFYRKGAVGEWQEYFTLDQRRWFKEEAGEVLIRAGYEKDANW